MTCTQLALALDLASPPTAAATTPAAATARTGCWVAVASAAHVRRGRAEGFMQVCHGKAAPLRRVWPGDRVVYYSPTITMGGNDSLRAFTALGRVRQGSAYPHDMGDGFVPWRRDVDWQAGAQDAPIAPLLPLMDWTRGQKNWAYPLRFGLFAIGVADMDCIAQAMGERVA